MTLRTHGGSSTTSDFPGNLLVMKFSVVRVRSPRRSKCFDLVSIFSFHLKTRVLVALAFSSLKLTIVAKLNMKSQGKLSTCANI